MSTSLILAQDGERDVPGDEQHVRSTVTVVDENDPPATLEHAPDFNETNTDPDTGGGLTDRAIGSAVNPSTQYPPHIGNANEDFSSVDREWSTKGTAAERENAGRWGHGTMHSEEGIEPVIRDGGEFREDYFTSDNRPVQQGSGAYMTDSRNPDDAAAQSMQAAANENARKAAQRAAYARFLEGMTN